MKKSNLSKLSKQEVINELTDAIMNWWETKDWLDNDGFINVQSQIEAYVNDLLEKMEK